MIDYIWKALGVLFGTFTHPVKVVDITVINVGMPFLHLWLANSTYLSRLTLSP